MAERHHKPDDHTELQQARATARETERAAAQLAEFVERSGAAIGPAELAEYDHLIAREAAAQSDRVEAFGRLGFGAPSLDATGPEDA